MHLGAVASDFPVPAPALLGPPAWCRQRCRLHRVAQAEVGGDVVALERRLPVEEGHSSEQLVRRVQAGDVAAFRELFRIHRVEVARLASRLLGQSADLEDVVQEVFLAVHRSLGDFRGQSKFSTWLYRVTVNVVLMSRRASRSRPQLVSAPTVVVDGCCDEQELPDEEVARRQRVEVFRRLLGRLSEKKRTVYVLHELSGISPAEIAKAVGAPVLTVRTRLFYARRELETMLNEEPLFAEWVSEHDKEPIE